MSATLTTVNMLFLLAVLFFCWKRTAVLKPVFIPAAAVKIIMGILLGWIYAFYYTVGDTLSYGKDGNTLAQLALDDFPSYLGFLWDSGASDIASGKLILTEPRAIFLSKMVSIFSIVTGGNYWMISAYFSVISFLGCWYFVTQVHVHIPSATWPAVISFLFFPSIVFWTSGVIKESIAIGAIAFISGLLVKAWVSSPVRWNVWIIALVAAWVAWNLKYYFAAIFFSVVITTIVYKFISPGKDASFAVRSISWLLIFSVLLTIASFLHPNFSPSRFFSVIVDNYQAFQNLSAPGDALHFSGMDEPGVRILYNAPAALFSGMYRPFLWEATDNVLQIWIGLENLVLLALTIIALLSIKQTVHSPHRILILSIMVYVVILCILLTLSTPNFGTLSRYRTGYLPFFILLILSSSKINSFLERSLGRLVRYKP